MSKAADEACLVRQVAFEGKSKYIICLKESKQSCPLVTLCNLFLLREERSADLVFGRAHDGSLSITQTKLESYISKKVEVLLQERGMSREQVNQCLPALKYEITVLRKPSIDAYQQFMSTSSFQHASQMQVFLFQLLKVSLYHAFLPDPKDTDTYNAVGKKSSFELYQELKQFKDESKTDQMSSQPYGDSQEKDDVNEALKLTRADYSHKMALFQKILACHELTPYGLDCLRKDVPEKKLTLLVLHGLSLMYKVDGVLHLLDTAENRLEMYPDLMWRALDKPNGTGRLLTSGFMPVNKLWRAKQKELLEEESKEEERKEEEKKIAENEKKLKKALREKAIVETKTQVDSESEAAITQVCVETKQDTTDDQCTDSLPDRAPSLVDRFVHFLKEFREGTEKPFFSGQVKSMNHLHSYHLNFCYDLILGYDNDLAVSISANYYSSTEDLRLCLCDYLCSTMADELLTKDEVLAKKEKILRMARLTICCIPKQNSIIISFKEFTTSNTMYKTYLFDGKKYNSTAYIGRMMARGYLKFILKTLKSGWSWNGTFKEEHMLVKIVNDTMEFYIALVPNLQFRKEYGISDLEKYATILFPHFMSDEVKGLPSYFEVFQKDIWDMPESNNHEEFDRYQKYMEDHLFTKAPLVRSALVTNTFRVCESLLFFNPNNLKPPFGPLACDDGLGCWNLNIHNFCPALLTFYNRSRVRFEVVKCVSHWCTLTLGRHAIEHLFNHTKKKGVQLLTDAIIVDLILEHDLHGAIANVIKKVMKVNNFEGRFASVWRHFSSSETTDEPKADEPKADEPKADGNRWTAQGGSLISTAAVAALASISSSDAATGGATSKAAAASACSSTSDASVPQPECALYHGRVMLTQSELRTLEGTNWLDDGIINYVLAEMSSSFKSLEDFLLVGPNLAYFLTNIGEDDDPEAHVADLSLGTRNLVVFPVNNKTEHDDAYGGNHWSLLVLHIAKDRQSCRFVHHDSIVNMNHSFAVCLANTLSPFLPNASDVVEGPTPPQVNGYDCGIYVLLLSRVIGKWWKGRGQQGDSNWYDDVTSAVTPERISQTRNQLWMNLDKQMKEHGQPIK